VYQASNAVLINNTAFHNFLKDENWDNQCFVGGTENYPSNHLVFRNNIFVGSKIGSPLLHIGYTAANPPEDIQLDHNLFYYPGATDSTALFEVSLRYAGGKRTWHLNLPE